MRTFTDSEKERIANWFRKAAEKETNTSKILYHGIKYWCFFPCLEDNGCGVDFYYDMIVFSPHNYILVPVEGSNEIVFLKEEPQDETI